MRNPGWAGAALIAVALAATACGANSAGGAYGSNGTPVGGTTGGTAGGGQAMPASPSSGPTAGLKAEITRAGAVLASSRGLTLYYYTQDKPHSGKSVCTGSCATAWPPLAAPVNAPSGVRLPGKLGMITRPGGVRQVTLNGFPVYLYAGDKAPGQAAGNGIGGSWHVIKIHVTAVTHAAVLKTETTRAGRVLASSRGLTLYYYTQDKPHSGKSACAATCATAWPPLAAPVKAPPGVRLPGKLGVITRPGGVKQVTLYGYPLYLYAGDKSPGQDGGNGIGGSWHVIKIKAKA